MSKNLSIATYKMAFGLVAMAGFEPATQALGVPCSVQLSYMT